MSAVLPTAKKCYSSASLPISTTSHIDENKANIANLNIKWVHLQKVDAFKPFTTALKYDDAKTKIHKKYNQRVVPDELEGKEYRNPVNRLLYYEGQEQQKCFNNQIEQNAGNTRLLESSNGFYLAFQEAWERHGKVILSPDDIWIAIQLQFSKYIDKNAEELRSTFVDHEGKIELVISMDDVGISSTPGAWPIFMERTISAIKSNVKTSVDKDFIPRFSTSTNLQQNLKHLAVMDNMKNYFEYTYSTLCGIESVGFLGELSDWQLLRNTVDGLKQFHLKNNSKYFSDFNSWVDYLLRIIDQFIDTYTGKKIDLDFWNGVIQKRQTHGSGASTYIRGWIVAFLSADYEKELSVTSVPSSRFHVPVKIMGELGLAKVAIIGGFTGVFVNQTDHIFRPQSSIAVMRIDHEQSAVAHG